MMSISETGERISPDTFESVEEYLLYLRCLFAYEFVEERISRDALVLEIGCGEGYGAHLLSASVRKIVATDRNRETVTHASAKYGSEKCAFVRSDGLKLPFKDGMFDAIISFQLIEHVEDDTILLSEIFRVLDAKGLFCLTTPNGLRRLGKSGKPWNKFHVREYRPEELERLLTDRFSDVTMWGIRGSEKVEKLETGRVRRTLMLRSLDPFGLRRILPDTFRKSVARNLRRVRGENRIVGSEIDFIREYGTKDYHVIKEEIADSLDLLGICRK